MDRRTVHRKGSYKNQRKGGGGILLAILAAVLVVGIGVFVYLKWPLFDFEMPKKPQETPDAPHTQTSATVDALLEKMTLEEKAYQMLFATPESITGVGQVIVAGDATRAAIEQYPVGGLIYFTPNLMSREQTRDMLANTQSYSEIPLFLGIDEEGGRVARIAANPDMGVENLPPMREIGDTGDADAAYNVGETLAENLRALGFNVDFAPVADVLINSDNTEIGDRAFGRDAETVSMMVPEVVSGLQTNGVSAVLKHFPGHGSALTDSHTGYTESLRTYEQLAGTEFLPFKAGIEQGANFVMVSHMTLVNAVEEGVPASLSGEVITEWLKEELGFNGIVITDSFAMGAITENYTQTEAIVLAVHAGADMILIPTDVKAAADAIVDAVQSGDISEKRIDESVKKILMCKEKMGIL